MELVIVNEPKKKRLSETPFYPGDSPNYTNRSTYQPTLLVLVDAEIDGRADRPRRVGNDFVVGEEVDKRGFADAAVANHDHANAVHCEGPVGGKDFQESMI